MQHSTDNRSALTRGDEQRWQAVMARDRAADGRFVYAVTTTGVFCRPSCPSRRALRENVSFFADCAGAVAAGYRACKRCRPDGRPGDEHHGEGIRAAVAAIEAAETAPTLDELAVVAGLSRFHFHRLFKAAVGVTPRQYAATVRHRRLEQELASGSTVTAAIYGAGYNSASRFYEAGAAMLGMTATAYREGGRGELIEFALGRSTLGVVLVAATAKGVCAIALGDEPEALVQELERRFANAAVRGPTQALAETLERTIALVEQPDREFGLPLDIRGTAFQAKVWAALRGIPVGATVSYGELAERLGRPGASRAVARACAANPLAVAVPCHRVVRSDGDVSGYRWGRQRKLEILKREAGRR